MTDNENSDLRQHPLSLSQKLLKKISVRSLHDTSDSDSSMDISTSPELHSKYAAQHLFLVNNNRLLFFYEWKRSYTKGTM
jgi:hypothetical protein